MIDKPLGSLSHFWGCKEDPNAAHESETKYTLDSSQSSDSSRSNGTRKALERTSRHGHIREKASRRLQLSFPNHWVGGPSSEGKSPRIGEFNFGVRRCYNQSLSWNHEGRGGLNNKKLLKALTTKYNDRFHAKYTVDKLKVMSQNTNDFKEFKELRRKDNS